jgi:hypothetical protein
MSAKTGQDNVPVLFDIEVSSVTSTKFGKQSDLKIRIEDFPDFETDTSSA